MKRIISLVLAAVMLVLTLGAGKNGGLEKTLEKVEQFVEEQTPGNIAAFCDVSSISQEDAFVVILKEMEDPIAWKDPSLTKEEQDEKKEEWVNHTIMTNILVNQAMPEYFESLADMVEDYPELKLGIIHFSYYDVPTWVYSYNGFTNLELTEDQAESIAEDYVLENGEEKLAEKAREDIVKYVQIGSMEADGGSYTGTVVTCYGKFTSYDKFGNYIDDYTFTWKVKVAYEGWVDEDASSDIEVAKR